MRIIYCGYCGTQAEFVSNSRVYKTKKTGKIYLCLKCGAYVGCHKRTREPLGTLADKELRELRMKAHNGFDNFWRQKAKDDGVSERFARSSAYLWLAVKLKISLRECHIGKFDNATCEKTICICNL